MVRTEVVMGLSGNAEEVGYVLLLCEDWCPLVILGLNTRWRAKHSIVVCTFTPLKAGTREPRSLATSHNRDKTQYSKGTKWWLVKLKEDIVKDTEEKKTRIR